MKHRLFILTLGLLLNSCKKEEPTAEQPTPISDSTRSYYLSFTPLPYEISLDAVNWTYAKIGSDADMICHSFDDGIPWVQSLNGQNFSAHVMDDWNWRKSKTPAGHKMFIQSTPLSFYRNALAPLRDTADRQALPAPWDTIRLNHPQVKTAYLNYCKRLIQFFQADYFNFGLEVNMLRTENPALWNDYTELHKYIYQELKQTYPQLKIFNSFQCSYLLEGQLGHVDYAAQQQALAQILPYTDIFAISIYPYATSLSTNSIPADMFDKLKVMARNKAMAVAETGYLASDLSLSNPPVFFPSDVNKQNQYIHFLLQQANKHQFLFVNNFVLRDYDKLWQQMGGIADISALWRNTGLYDKDGNSRPATETWRKALKRKKV